MKQTAVEWLEEHLSYDNGLGVRHPSHNETANLNEYFKLAKEMERQQIIDAYNEGIWERKQNEGEQYYNETFKQD